MSNKKQPKNLGWQRLANFFGVLGYISVAIEWVWIIALYLPSLLENKAVSDVLLPSQSDTPQHVISGNEPSLLLIIIAVVVTFLVIVASVVLLIRLPLSIARSSHTAIEKTAVASIPIITHHRPVTKKKTKLLTARIMALLKLLGTILPLFALLGIYSIQTPVQQDILILVSVTVAITALFNFSLQYIIARWRSVPSEQLL